MTKIDILFISGIALITSGIAVMYWPLALIFAGMMISIAALHLAKTEQAAKNTAEPGEAE